MILHVSVCHLHSTRCVKATTCVLLFFLLLPWFFFPLGVHAHIYTYELTFALSLSLSLGEVLESRVLGVIEETPWGAYACGLQG